MFKPRYIATIYNMIISIVFQPGNEENPCIFKGLQPYKVIIRLIKNRHISFFQRNFPCRLLFMNSAFGCYRKIWQITGVIEFDMQFDCVFGCPKLGPGKQRQAKINCSRVQSIGGLFQFHSEFFAGNITNSPAFVDFAGENFRQTRESPCVNSGFYQSTTSQILR